MTVLSKSNSKGGPVSIVKVHVTVEKQEYQLDLDQLESILMHKDVINKEVVLVSIAGAFRKGKSFMLNLFVNYLEWLVQGQQGEWLHKNTPMNKFEYRAGSEPHTNGITIWSKPYFLKGKEGKEYALFLMDSQGTFDHASTVKDCATIFAMSALLSSIQIFNLSQHIQADDLNNLRFFTEYAQLAESGAASFQKLLFLVRDWANPDDFDYGLHGGQEYLQKTLMVDNMPEENRAVRQKLKSCFEVVEACLLPHPGKKVAVGNSKTILGEIDSEFEAILRVLIPHLFSCENLVVKKVNGQPVKCGMLAEFFREYVKAFNGKELPQLKSLLDATADAVNYSAEQEAKDKYDTTMVEIMAENPNLCDLGKLDEFQKTAEGIARDVFEARPRFGDEQNGNANRTNLENYFKSRYASHKITIEAHIKAEEDKRELERLKAEREAELKKYEEMQKDLNKAKEEQIRLGQKMNKDMEELRKASADESEKGKKRAAELQEVIAKQDTMMKTVQEQNKKAEEELKKFKEAEEKREQERKRRDEELARVPRVVGRFSKGTNDYDVITNMEICNGSRYFLQLNNTTMDKGVIEIPPSNIGPGVTLRCSFHKTNYSLSGIAGEVIWQFTPNQRDYYDITLSFVTIYKVIVCNATNTIKLKITTASGPNKTDEGEGGPITLANHLVKVTATIGNANHNQINVSITDI